MILNFMLYASMVTVLLGLSAHFLERVVRGSAWPVRILWIGALVGSTLFPILTLSLRSGGAEPQRIQRVSPSLAWGSQPNPLQSPASAVDLVKLDVGLGSRFDVDPWLLGAWGFGSALLLGGLTLSYTILMRRSRGWVRRGVDGRDVWISADTGPAVVGFLRTKIVVPEWIFEHDSREREIILTHEEEHLRARDPHLLLGALLLLVALPWNVGLWWQWMRLRQAIEGDCDLRVLSRGVDPGGYSRLLIGVSERGTAHRLIVALSESPSVLEERIRRILAPRPKGWLVRAAASALSAAFLIFAACEMPLPTMTSVDDSLMSSRGRRAVEIRVPAPGDFVQQLMRERFPAEFERVGEGDTLILWFIASAAGEVERVALTKTRPLATDAEAVLNAIFPGVSNDEIYRSGTVGVSNVVALGGSPAPPRLPGPDELEAHWWQRMPAEDTELNVNFMEHPVPLSMQATVEQLLPEVYKKGLKGGDALWIAVDDSLRVYRAWIGPDFDSRVERGNTAEEREQARRRAQEMVDDHLAANLSDFQYRGVTRAGFIAQDGTPARLVWIEQSRQLGRPTDFHAGAEAQFAAPGGQR